MIIFEKISLEHFGEYLETVWIIDSIVYQLHRDKIDKIAKNNPIYLLETINISENRKTFEYYQKIMNFLFQNNVSNDFIIVSIGGGVVSDLVVFVASKYMRGINLIHVPTTLLSMVDSSIGGKNGINNEFGKGLLLGNITGVPPTDVVILGAGTVGEFAAKTALGLGANVKVFDNSITKLRRLQNNLNQRIFTSTIQPKSLLKALRRCDVAIGAMRGKDRCPVVVTETMVEHMKKGAVIVDVSIDTGGCFETSEVTTHESPTFIKNNIIHYCVPNIPSRYSKTASLSISNIITPYLLQIAEDGGLESAIRCNKGLKNGVYLYHGILTNKAIGDWFNLPDNDINLIVF